MIDYAELTEQERELLTRYRTIVWKITQLVDLLDRGEMTRDEYASNRDNRDKELDAMHIEAAQAGFDRATQKWLEDRFVLDYRDAQRKTGVNVH
jgi:hypothetical protein